MARKTKAAAAAAIQITQDCERDAEGYGALPFVRHTEHIVNQSDVSALKAELLAAGFESLDIGLKEWAENTDDLSRDIVRNCWEVDADAAAWKPQNDQGMAGAGWTLVAVLLLREDGQSVHDAIAVLARPAGMAGAEAWPFPKGKPGESGPEVASGVGNEGSDYSETIPQPAPITKSEAHLQRKPGTFQLLERTNALLKTFTPRVEKHGEDDVSAASLGLRIEAPNTILDLLSPSLRLALYAAPEGQVTLPGVEESTPLLRTKVIETVRLKNCYEGWTLRVYHGVDSEFVIGDCKVDKFVVTPADGGSVMLDLRIGSSDIDEEEAGWLYGKLRQEIEITLHAPEPKPEAIDGSVGHPGLAGGEPDARDLFLDAHGSDEQADGDQSTEEADAEA